MQCKLKYYTSEPMKISMSVRDDLTALCPGTKKDVVQTPWCPRSNCVHLRQLSARHFVCCIVGIEARGKNVGTDKIPFRLLPVPRNGARVLPLEVVFVLGHRQKALFRLSARAREPGAGT